MSSATVLNAAGLILGFAGGVWLSVVTQSPIRTMPDGSQEWGPGEGKSNEDWKAENLREARRIKFWRPTAFVCLASGFLLQLIALIV